MLGSDALCLLRRKAFGETLEDTCGQCCAEEDNDAPDILCEAYFLAEEHNPPYQCGNGYQKRDGQTDDGTDVDHQAKKQDIGEPRCQDAE